MRSFTFVTHPVSCICRGAARVGREQPMKLVAKQNQPSRVEVMNKIAARW
jgi:hypothetical protein